MCAVLLFTASAGLFDLIIKKNWFGNGGGRRFHKLRLLRVSERERACIDEMQLIQLRILSLSSVSAAFLLLRTYSIRRMDLEYGF